MNLLQSFSDFESDMRNQLSQRISCLLFCPYILFIIDAVYQLFYIHIFLYIYYIYIRSIPQHENVKQKIFKNTFFKKPVTLFIFWLGFLYLNLEFPIFRLDVINVSFLCCALLFQHIFQLIFIVIWLYVKLWKQS